MLGLETLLAIPEQDLARFTGDRIKNLAMRSGFFDYFDPAFGVVDPYKIGQNTSRRHMSLYRDPDQDVLILVTLHDHIGPLPLSGEIRFTDFIAVPDLFTIAGVKSRNYGFSANEEITLFSKPKDSERFYDEYLKYPGNPVISIDQLEEPKIMTLAFGANEEEGELVNVPVDDEIGLQLLEWLREYWANFLQRSKNSRTPEEVEATRARLFQLNSLIDGIDMERDLIPVSSV